MLVAVDLPDLLLSKKLTYEADVDVTQYKDFKRHPQNGTGTAGEEVWTKYTSSGASVRLLCPHAHIDPLWRLMATLEDCWGCFAGCNTYAQAAGADGADGAAAAAARPHANPHLNTHAPLFTDI